MGKKLIWILGAGAVVAGAAVMGTAATFALKNGALGKASGTMTFANTVDPVEIGKQWVAVRPQIPFAPDSQWTYSTYNAIQVMNPDPVDRATVTVSFLCEDSRQVVPNQTFDLAARRTQSLYFGDHTVRASGPTCSGITSYVVSSTKPVIVNGDVQYIINPPGHIREYPKQGWVPIEFVDYTVPIRAAAGARIAAGK